MENEKEDLASIRSMIEKLGEEYFTTEEKILSEIKKLPSYDEDCDCDERSRFCIVDDDIIACYCLNCGGCIYD